MARRKSVPRSAIDSGFRWTPEHLRLQEIVESSKFWSGGINSYGYAVTMFASACQYRDSWERWAREASPDHRVHLTPMGTYFMFQGNSNAVDWTGAYVRSDGTTGRFKGRYTYPLHCVGCGRADLRVAETVNCKVPTQMPQSLLLILPERPGAKRQTAPTAQPAPVISLSSSKSIREQPTPAIDHRTKVSHVAPPRPRGSAHAVGRSIASTVVPTLKFLLLMMLIAIAARRP